MARLGLLGARIGRGLSALGGLAAASAQADPGDHIRAGDAVITPEIDLGVEFHTNVYRAESDPVDGANARVAPSLEMALEGADHDFGLSGEWQVRKFFYVGESSQAGDPSQAERIRGLDRYNDFALAGDMKLFKRDVVGFELADRVSLRNSSTDAELAAEPFNTQIRNVLDGGLRLSPGPALSFTPGGSWAYDEFRTPAFIGQQQYNVRNTYGPTLGVRWDFFPNTAIVLDTSYLFHDWRDQNVIGGNLGQSIARPDSQHFKALTGLEGKVSAKLFVDALVGYGFATYDESALAPDPAEVASDIGADVTGLDGLLATLQVRYLPSTGNELSAGYKRDFQDAYFTNFRQSDMLYARAAAKIFALRPVIQHSVRFENYHGQIERRDALHRFSGDLTYEMREWADLTAGAWWTLRESADEPAAEYSDVNVHLLATFTY